MTRFVRKLVWMRRNAGLTPREAAALVLEHGKSGGFPCWKNWEQADTWLAVIRETDAEQSVICAGLPHLVPEQLHPDRLVELCPPEFKGAPAVTRDDWQ